MPNLNRAKNLALRIWLCHLGAAVYFFMKGTSSEIYLWVSAFIILASLPYLWALQTRRFVPYAGIYLFLAGFIVTYIIYFFFLPPGQFVSFSQAESSAVKKYDISILIFVIKSACLGIIAFIVGYTIGLGKKFAGMLPLKNFIVNDEDLARLPLKLYILWMIVKIPPFFNILMPTTFQFIMNALGDTSINIALATDTYLYFSQKNSPIRYVKNRSKKYLFRVVIFLSGFLFVCFYSGFSGPMMAPIVFIGLVYIRIKKKISFSLIISMAVAAALFISFVVPFTKQFRKNRYTENLNFEQSVDDAFKDMADSNTTYLQKASIGRLSNPLEMAIVCSSLALEGKKIIVYNDFIDFLSRFIPRFIWPDKPSVDYNMIGRELGVIGWWDYKTSISPTLLGGLILNGRIFGVIIGMFLVGILIRVYWDWLMVRSQDNFLSFIIYLILMYFWMGGNEDLVISLHSNIALLVYIYLFMGAIKRKRAH